MWWFQMTESGIILFHCLEFSEDKISAVVVHYLTRRGFVSICWFIYYFCLHITQSDTFALGVSSLRDISMLWAGTVSEAKEKLEERARLETHRKYLFPSIFKILSHIVFIVFGSKTCLWDTGDNIILLHCNALQSLWRICVHITSWKPHRTFNHRHT